MGERRTRIGMDRVSRMERARARKARRRAFFCLRWTLVLMAAGAFSLKLVRDAAGGLTGPDAALIFLSAAALWGVTEWVTAAVLAAARSRMRAVTRARVLARRGGRGANTARESGPYGDGGAIACSAKT